MGLVRGTVITTRADVAKGSEVAPGSAIVCGMIGRHIFAVCAALMPVIALACESTASSEYPDFTLDDSAATRPAAAAVPPQFIGSGGFGFAAANVFVGACAPQGLVKVAPDTSGPWGTVNFLHYAGYWYDDDTVLGFSHLHLHGTGAQDYGVLALMPTDAFDAARTTSIGYASKFDKATEAASPGQYAVTLSRGDIRVELTATPHGAHHRYTWPAAAASGHVIIDLDHRLSGSVKDAALDVDPVARTVRGSFRSVGGMSDGFGGVPVFFAMRTRQPWSAAQVWSDGLQPAATTHAAGTKVGAELSFDFAVAPGPVEVQVGISLVSGDHALANLNAEMPSFSFEAERDQTRAAWQQATGAVAFQGGTPAQQRMLEAALYHLFLMPTVTSDVDGSYVGLDGKTATADYRYVSDMSLWDTYRTLHPLYALIAPARARDAARSLTAMAAAAGYLPKWPLGTGEAATMLGASAEVVLADAYVKGIRDFDAAGVWPIMRAAALDRQEPPTGRGGRSEVVPYMDLGYVPSSSGRSVSWTIEYGQDDLALSRFASSLGHDDDAAKLAARSHGWKALYEPKSGFLWPKRVDGTFDAAGADPAIGSDAFAEANAWQSVWGPWYDFDTLAASMGGPEALTARLESFFVQGKAEYDAVNWSSQLSVGERHNFFWGGNEPDIHAPYLFALAGHPELTQKWLRWVEEQMYGDGADGLPGNDDGGTMSAWLVFSALGLYPMAGSDTYVVGAPMFPHAEIKLAEGTFTVEAPLVSKANLYVQSVVLNAAPLTKPWLRHSDLKAGGSLRFEMGATPSHWGR